MNISGIGAAIPARPAVNDAYGSQATSSPEESTALERLAGQMKKDLSDEEETRKARARQKLADAKEQLEFLKRWRFDPEVLARQVAQIAATVGAAAREFTAGVTDFTAPVGGPATTASGPAATTRISTEGNDKTEDDNDTSGSLVQRAYQEVQDDADPLASFSDDDRQTLEEIKDLARQLKKLLEEAIRRLRQDKNADQGAIGEAQTANDDMSILLGSVETLTAIPAGISITL